MAVEQLEQTIPQRYEENNRIIDGITGKPAVIVGGLGAAALWAGRVEEVTVHLPQGGPQMLADVQLFDWSVYSEELISFGAAGVAGGVLLGAFWAGARLANMWQRNRQENQSRDLESQVFGLHN